MRWREILAFTVALAVIAALVLLAVTYDKDFSERSSAASLLILSFVVFTVGGILYTGRAIWQWPEAQTPRYLTWERSFVIAAVVATALGLVLLEDLLSAAGSTGMARVGLAAYLLGAAVVLVAETGYVGTGEWAYPQVVLYVVLAFLAQAAIGVALVQTNVVSDWVGWVAIAWNLGCPPALLAFSRRDVYFPVLHHVAPLIIGIALLASG
jgi:hypothetical protein